MKPTFKLVAAFTLVLTCLSYSEAASIKKPKEIKKEASVTSEGFSYQIVPVPSFVNRLEYSPAKSVQKRDDGDAVYKLIDRQVSLMEPLVQEYVHYESEALSASALQDNSQVYISYNPAYQKLYVNSIRVWRNGKAIDLTKTVKLDLIRRESNLVDNMYQGEVTAIGVLPDIRINDVIDVEYTISGTNPIFGHRFSDIFTITQGQTVDRFRLMIITPEHRPIKIQPPAGVTVEQKNEAKTIRYTVLKENDKAVPAEDKTPDWYQSRQIIQVSEYEDWNQVSDWANTLFKVEEPFSPEITAQIQLWKDKKLTKEQLTVEVLRWVQSEIRYFGIELGVNSHLPSTPNATVARKFGDCKDKSLLLATLLKTFDIDAEPTLASMVYKRNVEKMMPSPNVFNHVIVRVRLDGKTYWLDPTQPAQYGMLSKLGTTDYGSVLSLGEGSGKLQTATFPSAYDAFYQTTHSFKLVDFKEPVVLTSRTKANYSAAEYLRFIHEKQSQDEFSKIFQEDVMRVYPQAKLVGNAEFLDDKINNEVTIVTNYNIDNFLKYEPGRLTAGFYATELIGTLMLPKVTQRVTPLALPIRTRIAQTEEFEFPKDSNIKTYKSNDNKNGEFWNLSLTSSIEPQKVSEVWALKANKEFVPPQKMPDFTAESTAVREQLAISYKMPVTQLTEDDKEKLGADLMRLERIYGASNSGRVAMEKKDLIHALIVPRDIASGKLSTSNLAEAHKIISQVYDNRGDVAKALKEIRTAEKLAPENLDYRLSEADTLLGDGQFAAANLLYASIIASEQASDDMLAIAHGAYGKSLLYLGQKDKALASLDLAFRPEDGQHSIYFALWQYIASGSNDNSKNDLKFKLDSMPDHSWPYAVGEMLLGSITPDSLIASASSSDKGQQEDQYCEAYFYIGQKYKLENNKDKAREAFQKSLAQGVVPYLETNFALIELGKSKAPKKESIW